MPEKTNDEPETTTACPSVPNPVGVSVKSVKEEALPVPPPLPVTPENIKELPSELTTTDWPAEPRALGVSVSPVKVVDPPPKAPVWPVVINFDNPEKTMSLPETTATWPSDPNESAVSVSPTKVVGAPIPPADIPEKTKEFPSAPTTTA